MPPTIRRTSRARLLVAAFAVAAMTPPSATRAQVAERAAAFSQSAPTAPPASPRVDPRDFPFLPHEAPHSVSVGDTSDGRLVHAARLDESAALGILPKQKVRGYRWGTTELVGALEHAAAELHRQTGTRLWVGHLSRRE
ncbi:MAG TPA: hypothetical protein ENK57_05305, partial [Polyangiaceae bacterium]|nr:hypothetical protein [Polyangiaceae bacterium]